jgi:large subunit ribosomal protein L31
MSSVYSAARFRAVLDIGSGGGTPDTEEYIMKADIHPNYVEIDATCSCGNVIKTRSTLGKNLSLDVCSECHPFYTGKQKVLDTGGRIDRFKQRFGVFGAK